MAVDRGTIQTPDPMVPRLRQRLREQRQRLRDLHDGGMPAVQICNGMSQLYDDCIAEIFWAAIHSIPRRRMRRTPWQESVALLAVGGLGRREVCPYSDADVLLLYRSRDVSVAEHVAGYLVRGLSDIGLDAGFAMRTAGEACQLAWSDPVIYSTQVEARLIEGSQRLYTRFWHRFNVGARRRYASLSQACVEARREERNKWGETHYLLRPNIKASRGGLRDIQLIRWLGFANYGELRLERLQRRGWLTTEDLTEMRAARNFLLRLRHSLHFRNGRAIDVLDRPTQLDLAADWKYEGFDGVLPVEQFMSDYFRHTGDVRYVSANFADTALTPRRRLRIGERIRSRQLGSGILLGPRTLWVSDERRDELTSQLSEVLRLMRIASEYEVRIEHETWQAIRTAMQERPPGPPDPASVEQFMELLSKPGRVASLLRRLHELRVLQQLIPAYARCRGLLQFNAYHQYTVDEHSLRAVEAATSMAAGDDSMGRRYRRIRDKALLHLALLIHDLGKGYEEDHSVVGERIAGQTAEILSLDSERSERLQWLVRRHLLFNEVAFRHDLNDPTVILRFAKEVATVTRLEMLLVHTVADLTAVGPEVINDWKLGLLEDLYLRTRRYFETGHLPGQGDPQIEHKRHLIHDYLAGTSATGPIINLVNQLPLSIVNQDPIRVGEELREISRHLAAGNATCCISRFSEPTETVRYQVVTKTDRRDGLFARLTAAIASGGLEIRRADVETVGSDLLWDCFWVADPQSHGRPPESRIAEVRQRLEQAVNEPDRPSPKPATRWKSAITREMDAVPRVPPRVSFDNETFEGQTILSLFAYDRPGLLSEIAWQLDRSGIRILFAKIDTDLDQVADVFYVVDRDYRPLNDPEVMLELREELMEVLA